MALALAVCAWAWVHALEPREDPEVDRAFVAAAAWVRSRAGPRDYVLVRPIWELAGARAFRPLPVGVYKRPVPSLWAGRERLWVATAHGAEPPRPIRAALPLGERKDFGPVTIWRFDVRRR